MQQIDGEATRIYEVDRPRPIKRVWVALKKTVGYFVGIFFESRRLKVEKYKHELYEETVARIKYENRRQDFN